ncbi:hypothetical protein MBLNU13_g08577t3 [Cladosporium sp. NU13]
MTDLVQPLNGGNFIHQEGPGASCGSLLDRFSLKGKTAVVTGAGAGIGLSVAQAFAELGANVAIWYNSNESAHDRAKEISEKYGVKCKAFKVNIKDYASVEQALDDQVREFNGRLDVFVANAGIPWTKGPMINGPVDHYSDVVATDLDSTYFCARAAAQHWKRQKQEGTDLEGRQLQNFSSGSFIATASMSGVIVNVPQLQAAYNAAKAGVIHLCKSLAVEWAQFARANSVSPGYIITEISNFVPRETKDIWKDKIPLGREAEVHELQGAYAYLASSASTYTTGSNLIVDGGYCVP